MIVRYPAILALALFPALAAAGADPVAPDPLAFRQQAAPLLQKYCFDCHGEKKQKGGVNFLEMKDLPSILNHRETWIKALSALESNDMPPDGDDAGFKPEERSQLIQWIKAKVETVDPASPIYLDPGPPLIRQLTRAEYNNTIRDLLKIDFDAASAAGIPPESVVDGFDNQAMGLVTDQTLLEKYFTAADASIDYLFDADPARKNRLKAAREGLFVARPSSELSEREAARKVLSHFARRAFRRPVESEEIDRLMPLVDEALKSGAGFEGAVRRAMKPILVSPFFLYRIENDHPASTSAYRVSDHELAVRLSYFLWSTMPDDELFALAEQGSLSDPQVLQQQVKRMLADPRATAFTQQFAVQWLTLGRLRMALPSRDHFPALTNSLKDAMMNETTMFFDNLRTEDRSILDLLDCDYTFANEELARHYGISGVSGKQMRRVALQPQDHRGGLLGMSSILTLTSHTDRTKPTARGKWILQVILGTPPAPPPPDAGSFKDTAHKQEPRTFRERLALHASNATCAGCHKKVDPLGFALENYDAIGAWREQVGGEPVDNKGRLPGTGEFEGVDGLKAVLKGRRDQFVRNMAVQSLGYALGRKIEYEDELAVQQICQSLRQEDFRFSTLVRSVVMSRPFQYRRDEAQ